jgi:cyclase
MAHYRKGLEALGNGCWAYLQPDGSWGWSNAGLITDGEACLLVDTLFDTKLTAEMLAAMRASVPAAEHIATVVNTHANGDHCWGNELVRDAEIIASRRSAAEMAEISPAMMAKLDKVARLSLKLGGLGAALGRIAGKLGIDVLATVVEAAPYLVDIFGEFHFQGIELVLPTRTFDGELALQVGQKRVELIEVGPAHTKGDVIVHVPTDRVIYTGDILFIEGHPIIWEGPVSNWVAACKRILALDLEAIVPGHGPMTDKQGVRALMHYLEFVDAEARKRFEAGMGPEEAARDIALSEFDGWKDAERIVVNVDTIWREWAGKPARASAIPCFAAMARHAGKRRATASGR